MLVSEILFPSLPVFQRADDPSSRFVLAPHQHVLHLHLSDGGQQKRHTDAEQSQLRRQKGTGGRLLLLAIQELQPPLELHSLQEEKRRGAELWTT